jgi:predicted dehydrogenase
MKRQYRAGIIGFGHAHVNHVAALFAAHPQVQWVACADTTPLCPELRVAPYTREWNRQNVMRLAGIPKCYPDYRQMLAEEDFDVMLIECENAQHADVVEACAQKGIHVCVEKPMATSLGDALRMARACRAAGTTMLVNWPSSWLPHTRKAKELIDAGAIGRVVEVNYRVGHAGPYGPGAQHKGVAEAAVPLTGAERGAIWIHQAAAGGGALVDLCCYGLMYGLWYTDKHATAVLGTKANLDSPWSDADDNGVLVAHFPGAIAVAQGSWTTVANSYLTAGPVVVYGTAGKLSFEIYPDKPVVRVERGGATEPEIHTPDPLPADRADIAQEFLRHIETGRPAHPTLTTEFNLQVAGMIDAGDRSAARQGWEPVSAIRE